METEEAVETPPKRGRGRPPGSLNKRGSKARGYVDEVTTEIKPEVNETGPEEEVAPPEEEEEEEVQIEPEPEPEQVPEPEPEPKRVRQKVQKPKPTVEPIKPPRKPKPPVRAPARVEPEPPPMTYSEALRRFHEDTIRIRNEELRNHYASFFR